MNASSVLYGNESEKPKQQRIDLAFEMMVLRCGIGCIINDMPMSDEDYVRLYLAMSRLGKSNGR